jgi:membrane protein required for colicin V production
MHEMLTWFDFVLLAILAASVVLSFIRGFFKEVISIVTWISAIVLAFHFSPQLELKFTWFDNEMWRYMAAFSSIIVVIFVIGAVCMRFVKTLSHSLGLGVFDHVLGFVFGAARGLMAVVVLMMLISATPFAQAQWYAGSQVAIPLRGLIAYAETYLPQGLNHVNDLMGREGEDRIQMNSVKKSLSNYSGRVIRQSGK